MTETSQPQELAKARLLVVDDNAELRDTIGKILRFEGFLVDEGKTGEEALEFLERTPYDLMIVDLVMPGMSGVEVIQRARLVRPALMIIVLTAHPTVESAIAAVKSDVTDYLLKPCAMEDLTEAISKALQERTKQFQRAHLLNMINDAMVLLRDPEISEGSLDVSSTSPAPMSAEDMIRVGVLSLDRQRRIVTLKEDPPRAVELTEGELSVLITLMEKPNQVFSYHQLAKSALGYDGMDKWTVESVIRSCVFRLRKKLELDPNTPRLIRTVRGRGYFFSPA